MAGLHEKLKLTTGTGATVQLRYLDQLKGYHQGDPDELRLRGNLVPAGTKVELYFPLDRVAELQQAGIIQGPPNLAGDPPWKVPIPRGATVSILKSEDGYHFSDTTPAQAPAPDAAGAWPTSAQAAAPAPQAAPSAPAAAAAPQQQAPAVPALSDEELKAREMARSRLGWAMLREATLASMRIAAQAFEDLGYTVGPIKDPLTQTPVDQGSLQDLATSVMIRGEHENVPTAVGLTKTDGWPAVAPAAARNGQIAQREPGED